MKQQSLENESKNFFQVPLTHEQLVMFYAIVREKMLKLSQAAQESMDEMVGIILAGDADEDQKAAALDTIVERIFPQPYEGKLGVDLQESELMGSVHSEQAELEISTLSFEEKVFAERLRHLMKEKEITQEELADTIGVSQSAISHMLNRDCRPQKKTINKIAKALGVTPEILWPKCG